MFLWNTTQDIGDIIMGVPTEIAKQIESKFFAYHEIKFIHRIF